ncbi:MAG: hypothetical protein JW918_05345 [Anaerolineae bacterium]|nr:hypothetical protein [Anaerolineae bacterium]
MNNRMAQHVSAIALILVLTLSSTACILGLPSLDDDGQSEMAQTDTAPPPTGMRCSAPASGDLGLDICWSDQVEPPQELAKITIEMTDPDAGYSDWVVGDASEQIAGGRLDSGESTTVEFEVDWHAYPYQSSMMFYVYGRGDDGSTFAEVVKVHFHNPDASTPYPTMSCGYAGFAVTTAPVISIEHPDGSFSVGIANAGIFECGDLDWWVVEPSLQGGALACSPASGVLDGAQDYKEPNTAEILCSVDWDSLAPGQTGDYFLVLFSYPRVNGTDSVHLIRVRAVAP